MTYHSFFPEVDADCSDELGVELVIRVSVKKCGLPYSGVPQGKELYKVVIIPVSHCDDCSKPAETDGKACSLSAQIVVSI